jgi:hypothetical protein
MKKKRFVCPGLDFSCLFRAYKASAPHTLSVGRVSQRLGRACDGLDRDSLVLLLLSFETVTVVRNFVDTRKSGPRTRCADDRNHGCILGWTGSESPSQNRDAHKNRHDRYCFQSMFNCLFLDSGVSRTIKHDATLLKNIRPLGHSRTVQRLTCAGAVGCQAAQSTMSVR